MQHLWGFHLVLSWQPVTYCTRCLLNWQLRFRSQMETLFTSPKSCDEKHPPYQHMYISTLYGIFTCDRVKISKFQLLVLHSASVSSHEACFCFCFGSPRKLTALARSLWQHASSIQNSQLLTEIFQRLLADIVSDSLWLWMASRWLPPALFKWEELGHDAN